MHQPLSNTDYTYQEVDIPEFRDVFYSLEGAIFVNEGTPNNYLYSPEEEEALKGLRQNAESLMRLNIVIYHQGDPVGWMWGKQRDFETFHMVNSGLLPAHRNKGIYTKMLQTLISKLSSLGFQIIQSKHRLHNSQVLIPKLKAGFFITGINVDERFGTLATLSYYTNDKRREQFVNMMVGR